MNEGEYQECWRQLEFGAETAQADRGNTNRRLLRDELQRGMPNSPYVTYFCLEVTNRLTESIVASALFRCVLVPDSGTLGWRSWTLKDGFVRSHLLSPVDLQRSLALTTRLV